MGDRCQPYPPERSGRFRQLPPDKRGGNNVHPPDHCRWKDTKTEACNCGHPHANPHEPINLMDFRVMLPPPLSKECNAKRLDKTHGGKGCGKGQEGRSHRNEKIEQGTWKRRREQKCLKHQPLGDKSVKRRKG